MTEMLIDSHCHLDMLEGPVLPFIERAEMAGISGFLTISTRLSTFYEMILPLTRLKPHIFCSVGVHPHHVESEEIRLESLLEAAKDEKVIAIGESGLDFHYSNGAPAVQEAGFLIHIEAARETGLPLVIHNRNSDEKMIEILAREKSKNPYFTAILHCFTGSKKLADFAVEAGFYISFSGIITFKNAEDLCRILADIPANQLLIETDAPYLAPVPKRGKKNEPSFLPFTAQKAALCLDISEKALAELTTTNFFRLFSKAKRSPAGLQGPNQG